MKIHLWLLSRRYLKDEHKAKKGIELDGTKWTIGSLRAGVSQVNGCMQHSLFFFLYNINSLCTVAISVGDSTAEKWQ